MIKILATVVVLGAVSNFAGFAIAQDKRDEAFVAEVSSVLAKKKAQCTHRRIMPPDSHDDCFNRQRGDVEIGTGRNDAVAAASGAGSGIGPGNGGGPGNGIGPGNGGGRGNGIGLGIGGGQGRGRR